MFWGGPAPDLIQPLYVRPPLTLELVQQLMAGQLFTPLPGESLEYLLKYDGQVSGIESSDISFVVPLGHVNLLITPETLGRHPARWFAR